MRTLVEENHFYPSQQWIKLISFISLPYIIFLKERERKKQTTTSISEHFPRHKYLPALFHSNITGCSQRISFTCYFRSPGLTHIKYCPSDFSLALWKLYYLTQEHTFFWQMARKAGKLCPTMGLEKPRICRWRGYPKRGWNYSFNKYQLALQTLTNSVEVYENVNALY